MLGVSPQLFRHRAPFRLLAIIALSMLAIVPAGFIAERVADASRNVAYWDEIDTALNLVLQLDSGLSWSDFFARIFALSNEHRMVTSRLIFAASYWLTGTVDFAFVGLIGNASLIALCALLLYSAKTTPRRLTLALILSMLMFQLQHFENLFWSGASIDHFQVVFLAAATVVALAHGTRPAMFAGVLCALLATFTLAHGILTWVVGLWMLWSQRRFQHLVIWSAFGAVAIGGFMAGFHVNSAQRFSELSAAGVLLVLHYWLALLGSLPALGNGALAPWLGAVSLVGLGWLAMGRAMRRESVAFPLACFVVAALGMIAVGRAADSGGIVHSRYYVLGALGWGLIIFMVLERFSDPQRPYRLLIGAVPLLVAFNLTANHRFAQKADSWIECRDRAAVRFQEHGVDGRGPLSLYPLPERSTRLLNEAERRGVYRMPPICEERSFPDAKPSTRITYFVDEMAVSAHSASVGGWAVIPGVPAKRGQIHLVLSAGDERHVFTTVTVSRPDVADSLSRPDSVLAGFRFARRRDQLPTGEFQVGLLIKHGRKAEYIMTAHRVRLVGDGQALLASAD
jgi:hypothetical protein